jgi:two-component system phosphate regulon sensor histidine kinase PhoR
LTKKIFKSILAVCALTLVLGLAFVMGILYNYFGKQINTELRKEAAYLAEGVALKGTEYLENITSPESRITYIGEDGTVLYDSEAAESSMENHGHREEVMEALQNGTGHAVRMSGTLSEKTIYHAVRLENGNVLRVSSTQYSILKLVLELVQPVLWILLLMLVLAGVFASRLSKKVVEPLNNLDLEHPEQNQIYPEVEPLLSKIYKQKRQITSQLEAAKQQQEEFAIITENMQEGLLVIDNHTMVLSVNSSVSRLFQVQEIALGESVYSLNRSEQFRKVVEDVLEGRHSSEVVFLDGNAIAMTANPVFRDKEIQGAVLLFVNVTEKVSRETLRREFSANVSHELKTPLTSISGFAEIMQDGFVKEEDVKRFAGRIYREAQRLIQLVEDTIKISQLDEGEVPYEKEQVDLYELGKDIFNSLKTQADSQSVHLYMEGEHVSFTTVRPILEEVLYNLCDNAIKYNRPEGSVTLAFSRSEKGVAICVKDTGIGIPREDRNRIFERFYRVDKSHSKEVGGTGLGLSIVKHGAAFLGGELDLASEEGKGTEISLVFPEN